MSALRRLALAALAALPLSAGSPRAGADPAEVTLAGYVHDYAPGYAIGGETDPDGWVLSPSARNQQITLPRIAYLDGTDARIRFKSFAGKHCVVTGVLVDDALTAGGVETPSRAFDLLKVTSIKVEPIHVPRPAPILKRHSRAERRLLADLARRGVEFADGPSAPNAPLDADGRINGRRRAKIVPLALPPAGSADMYTDLAYVDTVRRRYWAHRSGGFAGVSQWVGPFRLPRR